MKARSFCAQMASLLVFVAFSTLTSFAQSSDLKPDLQSSFSKFDLVRIDTGDELRTSREGKTLTIRAGDKNFELVVTLNDLRSRRYRAEDTNMIGTSTLAAPSVNTYKGVVAGEADSEVRLTINGVKVEGYFESASGRLFIEPASKYSSFAEPGDTVVYKAEDSLKDNTFFCESDIASKIELGREM